MAGRFRKSGMPCYHYNNGRCRNSAEACRFDHILAGPCKDGTSCKKLMCPFQHKKNPKSNRGRHFSSPQNNENGRINRRRRSEDYSRSNRHRNTHNEENRHGYSNRSARDKGFQPQGSSKSRSRDFSSNTSYQTHSSDVNEDCISEQRELGLINGRLPHEEEVDSEEFVTVTETGDSEDDYSPTEENLSVDNAQNVKDDLTQIKNGKNSESTLAELERKRAKLISEYNSTFTATPSNNVSNDPVTSRIHNVETDTPVPNVVKNDFEVISEDSNSSDVDNLMIQNKKETLKTDEKPSDTTQAHSSGFPYDISESSNSSSQNNDINRNKQDCFILKSNASNETFAKAGPSFLTPNVSFSIGNTPEKDVDTFSKSSATIDTSLSTKSTLVYQKNDQRKKSSPVKSDGLVRKCLYEGCDKEYPKRRRGTFKCHVLSHYYKELKLKMWEKFGFVEPANGEYICKNYQQEDCELKTVQRDYITLLRHYAFKHGYLLSLTSCKPEYLEGLICSNPNLTKEHSNQADEVKYKSKEFISDDETDSEDETTDIVGTKSANQLYETSKDSTVSMEIGSETYELPDIDPIEMNTKVFEDSRYDSEGNETVEQLPEDKRSNRYLKKDIEAILMEKIEADFESKLIYNFS